MEHRLRAAWQRRGWVFWLLWPLSWLYAMLRWASMLPYERGWRVAVRAPVPVVVVGNVVVGGGGKTPVVMALVDHLRGSGYRPGVISRGYGRHSRGLLLVHEHSTADEVGDEPLLIRQRMKVPVAVARRRSEAVAAMLEQHPDVNIIVSDDGLQHRSLAHDLSICVFGPDGLGNGRLLPAGPLREPWPRAVDLVVVPDGAAVIDAHAAHAPPQFRASRRLAADIRNGLGHTGRLTDLVGQEVVAVAGIAHPEAFFALLEAQGLTLMRRIPLPDHHPYDAPLSLDDRRPVLCTEKDAAKLWAQHPQAWAIRLELELPPGFWTAFERRLTEVRQGLDII